MMNLVTLPFIYNVPSFTEFGVGKNGWERTYHSPFNPIDDDSLSLEHYLPFPNSHHCM